MSTEPVRQLRLTMEFVTKIADMSLIVNWMEKIVYVLQVAQMTSKLILSVTKNVMSRHAIGMITLVLSVQMAVGLGCFKTMSVKMNVKI